MIKLLKLAGGAFAFANAQVCVDPSAAKCSEVALRQLNESLCEMAQPFLNDQALVKLKKTADGMTNGAYLGSEFVIKKTRKEGTPERKMNQSIAVRKEARQNKV